MLWYALLCRYAVREGMLGKGHPSIFVGPNASESMMHVDSRLTRFWMAMVSGKKHWHMFHPKDIEHIYPAIDSGWFPSRFDVDTFRPDLEAWPLLQNATMYKVYNPGPSIALAYNYVDRHNWEAYKEFKRVEYEKDERDDENKDKEVQMASRGVVNVVKGRVQLVRDEKAFRAAFERIQERLDRNKTDEETNAFSEAKLSYRGEDVDVVEVYNDHTFTFSAPCKKDHNKTVRYDVPFEVVAKQLYMQSAAGPIYGQQPWNSGDWDEEMNDRLVLENEFFPQRYVTTLNHSEEHFRDWFHRNAWRMPPVSRPNLKKAHFHSSNFAIKECQLQNSTSDYAVPYHHSMNIFEDGVWDGIRKKRQHRKARI